MTLRSSNLVAAMLVSICVATRATTAQVAPVDAGHLPLGMDSLDIFLVRGGEQRNVGRLWDELRRVDRNGIPTLRRTYRTENAAFGPTVDTSFSRWPTLEPMAHKSTGRQAVIELHYRPRHEVGSVARFSGW